MPLSILIPTFNSRRDLTELLPTLQWANEILVVDSFSTDDTVAVAQGQGARVIQHDYLNSAKQKNWAIPQCAQEWVLIVDTDERLPPELIAELQALLTTGIPASVDAYCVARQTFVLGQWVKAVDLWPDYQTRLLRRAVCRYEDKEVHAHVIVPGQVQTLHHPLHHHSTPTLSKQIGLLDRYSRYQADELVKRGVRFRWHNLLLRPPAIFAHQLLFRGGLTAGFRGWFLAFYGMTFSFFTHAKLWEKEWQAGVAAVTATASAPKRLVLVEMSAEMGGVEFSTLYLVQNLDRAAWAPVVICPSDGPLVRLCAEAGVPCQVVPLPRMWGVAIRVGARWLTNPLTLLGNVLAFARAAWRLAGVLRQLRAQLVCTKGLYPHFYGGLAARLAGVPCVWHLQDLLDSQRGFGLYPLAQAIGARWLADGVLADGRAIARQLPPRLFPAPQVHVIYNGVNPAEFSPEVDGCALRAEWGVPPEAVVIGSAARLTEVKGQHVLLQAAPELLRRFPHAWLVVVGSALFTDQHYEQTLRQLALTSGAPDRIVFAGFRADLNRALAAMDVFAYTATSHDTSPLALISALAAGKPSVVADIPGVAEIFKGQTEAVTFVPPHDPAALTQALARLVADPALRQRQAAAARQIALARFSVQEFTRQCAAVFERHALAG